MKPELQPRLREWHRRIDLTDLSDDDKERAKAGLTREFGEKSRPGFSLLNTDFYDLFSWMDTIEGGGFWGNITDALYDADLCTITPIHDLIAAAKAYPKLADLARRAEESL